MRTFDIRHTKPPFELYGSLEMQIPLVEYRVEIVFQDTHNITFVVNKIFFYFLYNVGIVHIFFVPNRNAIIMDHNVPEVN